jgi:hypothetical protein
VRVSRAPHNSICHSAGRTLVSYNNWEEEGGDLHIKSHPFGTWRDITVHSTMEKACEWRDRAWDNAVPVGEEGIGPLLQEAVEGGKVMRGFRSKVELPLTRTYGCSGWSIVQERLL